MMHRRANFGMIGAMLLAALSAVIASPSVPPWTKREARARQHSIQGRADRGPNGLSFRSLKRAVNAGWAPPQPSMAEMKRHAWFQKKLNAARLRMRYGQEFPGDEAFVTAATAA